jgi:topoisomerase-4 subunit A
VHLDGKSKNYMVKRFVFENTALGKQTSIISDEGGSKLVFISSAAQVMVKVDLLKGKTETPESTELDLSTLIDVKGMKAMGNRISQHPVKSVELLAEINPIVEEPEAEIIAEEPEIEEEAMETSSSEESQNEKPEEPQAKAVELPKQEPVEPKETKPAESQKQESVESSNPLVESPDKSAQSPPKKIDLEITNPDDLDIDDKGQLGLF